jgi:anti-sigma B factor antagonist
VPTTITDENVDSPPCRPLTVRSRRSGRDHVIVVTGELDIAAADAVARELIVAERSGARRIALDLRELSFIDCSGVRVIVAAHRRAAERLVIVKGPRRVQRVFELCDLDSRMSFVDEPPSHTGFGPPASALRFGA